jgi:hypothetical protein
VGVLALESGSFDFGLGVLALESGSFDFGLGVWGYLTDDGRCRI